MDLPALQGLQPVLTPVANAQAARTQQISNVSEQMRQQAAQIELLATGMAYALPNGVDGPVDEKKFNEVLDSYEQAGMPADKVAQLRQRPDLATVILRSSSSALSASHDEQLFPLKMQQMQVELEKALAAPTVELTPDQKLLDQINAERAAKKQPPLGLEEFLAGKGGPPNPTTDQQNLEQINVDRKAAGQPLKTMEEYLADKGGNGITLTNSDGSSVQVGGKGLNAYDVEDNKRLVKLNGEIADAGRKAQTTKATLGTMKQMLGSDQVYTGIGADQVQELKRAAVALGLGDPESVKDTETFNGMSRQAALDVMGGSLGTGFSNADRDFVIQQVPNLHNTKEGNLQLIDIQEKISQRKVDIAKFATDYKKAHNGRLDGEFEGALADWAEQHPIFEAKKDAGTTTGSGGSSPATDLGAPPEGVTADEWSAMTPEERKLWQN